MWGVMPQLFGQKLRHLRHNQNLTQIELAKQLALSSYTHITKLEADQRTPSLDLVIRLATALDESVDYFLRDTLPVEASAKFELHLPPNNQPIPQLFGPKLRALRLQSGWGQTEMARRLGLARRGYISNLEGGRKMPSLDLVVVIADLFEVTTDYLLRDAIPAQSYSSTIANIPPDE